MSLFTHVRDTVESFFTGPVWTFLKPIVTVIESQGGTILLTAAENAVAIGFTAAGNPMGAALAAFEAEVVAKGLPFIESQARTLIELALQKTKAAVPATPAPDAVAAV